MPKSASVHARIEPELKEAAEAILKELGLNATQAITLFLPADQDQPGPALYAPSAQ